MINLIPPSAKKDVQREYMLRVLSAWLILIGSACISIVLLLVSVYMIIQNQLDLSAQEFSEANLQKEDFLAAQEEIRNVNEIATYLETESAVSSFVTLFDALETLATPLSIEILSFTAQQDTGEAILTISGSAPSYKMLVNFAEVIEAHELFVSVDVTTINLTDSENISFAIAVIPNQSTQ